MQCIICTKKLNPKDKGEYVDHILFRHPINFFKWSWKNNKFFKIANRNDLGELMATFYKNETT